MTEQTLTNRTTSPFRFDVVGSFLRPAALKAARKQYAAGNIAAADLKQVEDQSIIELIKKEEAAGLQSITDGEFRRSWWHLDFFWGLNGVEKTALDQGYIFNDEETRAETARLSGKITGTNHPFVDHFKFLRAHLADPKTAKQTIPAPAQFIAELYRPENIEATNKYYSSEADLIADIAKAYQQVALDLYDAGLRVLQLDDCTWGMLAGFHAGAKDGTNKIDQAEIDKNKELYVNVNNAFIEGLPEDLIVNTHDCRGNYHSTWASAGGYESVAEPLFTREKVHAFFLEYDNDRSGGFEPLAQIQDDQLVVLGLITSKSGELEDKQTVIDRIHEAAKYVPLDRLCLSTQCGFASTEEGNILTEDQQWAKIQLVKDVAEEVWGA
ncbi:methionine synthase, vitamin-B12 independent [Paucilactobacillus vaccinostercus DSM 20634]|uniref:Methionine synthase, vitamin-B12 independent n=1 Tax=Paucilactobacillus vaccinostercus DSM 20634 TaxID=1423813 RepID=A0A0R2A164_9LACO|nr:5-methyltetrahydropteroyltriglutamate--homocysteine S-methyltransferase [Paucilactobacillus vaccinostercus]KRM60309.1 methionine synthase, vitamin-B12 independent [Paucilactobacillus vaccinostercus DSM 20634]